jgi:hypothetical protein
MPLNRRSNTRLMIYRLGVLLISMVVIGYALAASESKKTASEPPGIRRPTAAESKPRETPPPSTFVPSEKVSADKAVSFPTDI